MRHLYLALVAWLVWAPPAWAQAISYVGGQAGNFVGTVSNTDITFSLTNGSASTPAANDLVVVTLCTGSTADRTLDIETTGAVNYTLVGSELYSNDTTNDTNMRVAYRVMPSTPETQVRFAGGSGNAADGAAWSIHVYRGAHLGTPLDVVPATATGIDTHLINPPSITPQRPGSWVQVSGCGATATGANYTTSGLTDFRTSTGVDTQDGTVGSGYTTWSSGPYDHAAFSGGGTDSTADTWASVVLAIRRAGFVGDVIGSGRVPAPR